VTTLTPPRRPAAAPPPPPPPHRGSRLPWRSAEAKAVHRDNLATLCLFLVTLAVALSLGRLFRGTTWLPYAVAAASLGHGLAWGLRRFGAGLTMASLSSALLSILVAVELVVPQATTFGFPTPFTFEVLGQALVDAQTSFRNAVAPVVPSPGFVAAAVVGVCMCAFLADWAAFRMRTAFEACVPGLALFVFTAILGAKTHRGLAVAGFAAASLVFLIVQRANLDGGQTAWFGGRDRGALPSLLATGAILGAVAVIGALVLSPIVPGATAKPVLSFKKGRGGPGSGSRSTVSPLVDIQTRLREYANIDVFTVKAERPAYWRLTSLDQFNGTIWSSNERYATTRGSLPQARELRGTPLVQEVSVSGLASIWLPGAYHPTEVRGIDGLSYSPGSGSLITKKDTTNGVKYTITSTVPEPTADQLRRAPTSTARTSALRSDFKRYTDLGGRLSNRVRSKATELGSKGATSYDKAIAIQDFLRSDLFEYSLDVDPGHSGNAIDDFLFNDRVGYCEQFAGSFAVLARLLGLPTRVAVGFQPGAGAGGTFSVKDKDAHAWPEVYFEGIGWTAFEPTKSAGNPQAQAYTGVPYVPAEPTAPESQTTPTTVAPSAEQGSSSAPLPEEENPTGPEELEDGQDEGPLSWIGRFLRRTALLWISLILLAGLAGLSAAFVAWDRRRHRRLAGGEPEARVHTAWEESMQALSLDGVRLRPAETVAEFLHRLRSPAGGAALAGVERGTPANEALVRLGQAVAASAYTGRGASPAMADTAEADRDVIVGACRACLSRSARLKADIDPRPALTRLRTTRAKTRPTPETFESV
jgi:transglutaminase-like putative cysteine protease